jgi:hypothetical protein
MINRRIITIFIMMALLFSVSTASAACTQGKCTCNCSKCQTDSCTCSACTDSCPLTKCIYGTSSSSGATCSTAKTCSSCSGCAPNFTFSKSGKSVQFKDATPKGKYWHWDFNNDGKIDSYKQNPKYTFSKTGSYKVCLDVSCGGTSGWKKVCKTVTV